MRLHYRRPLFFSLLLAFSMASSAQIRARITAPVDSAHMQTLSGNISPLAQPQFDRGPAPVSMSTGTLYLVMSRSASQNLALQTLLGEQQNSASPEYRRWLTPSQYASRFGVSSQDYNTIAAWLAGQGFEHISLLPGGDLISFSGTVGQLNTAFHTSIDKFDVHGQAIYANASNPSIPAALAPVVSGIVGMGGIRPHGLSILSGHAHFNPAKHALQPELTETGTSGTNYFLPDAADAAIIYDTPNSALNPSYSGTSYDGSGITIGIAGDSNLSSQAISDIANYRALFLNDPTGSHPPKIIVDGNNPGENGDEIEALTDIELAEAIAPGANINFYTAADTDLQSGLFLAMVRAVDDNAVSILNVSFGECEPNLGAAYNAFMDELWEQAAAQGITVTVSSGDSGSAGCDDNASMATHGLAVNGLASTPYDVAVGGTDFPVLFTSSGFSQYVSTGNTIFGGTSPYWATAKGYIPEEPWNDTSTTFGAVSANKLYAWGGAITTTYAGGGGASSSAYCASGLSSSGACSGTLTGYPKPAFQTGSTPNDSVRDVPDVSFFSGVLWNDGGYSPDFIDSWTICSDSITNGSTVSTYADCQLSNGQPTTTTTTTQIGGTSTAAPLFAGMLALVEQSQGGVRLGQVDNILYNLAANQPAAFHDVTVGNNAVTCKSGTLDCGSNGFTTDFNAGSGYDKATGLGSVDVAKLISAWNTASFQSTSTSLAVGTTGSSLSSSPIMITHGDPVYFSANVSPSTAQGDVAFVNTSGDPDASSNGYASLSNGAAAGSGLDLPGGQYTLYARYGGDTKDAASLSNGISVTVAPEASTLGIQANLYAAAAPYPSLGQQTSIPYGQYAFLQFQPYGVAGQNQGTPATGTIAISQNGASLASVSLDSSGVGSYGFAPADLPPGTYKWTADYSGDASYNASTASTSLTVTKAAVTMEVNPPQSYTDTNGGEPDIEITAKTSSGGASPTGPVTLYMNGKVLMTANMAPSVANADGTVNATAVFLVPLSDIGKGNTATFYGSYGGDSDYQGGSSPSISITDPGPNFTLATSGNITIATPGQGGTLTVALTPTNGFTGTVNLQCAISGGPANAVDPPTCTLPSTASLSGTATSNATVSVSTTGAATSQLVPSRLPLFPIGGAAFSGLLIFLVAPRRRRKIFGPFLMVMLLAFTLTSCSSGNSFTSSGTSGGGSGTGGGTTTTTTATTAGTYTITVTGTATGLNPVTSTTTVTVQ